jgi:hypothetical protein
LLNFTSQTLEPPPKPNLDNFIGAVNSVTLKTFAKVKRVESKRFEEMGFLISVECGCLLQVP